MSRDSKGKVVKTFTARVPQPDAALIDAKVSVYFKAESGTFQIFLPDHVAALLGKDKITAQTQAEVLASWENDIEAYRDLLKMTLRQKVIRFTLKYNSHRHGIFRRDEITFSCSPTLHLTYEIYWDVNGVLYTCTDDVKNMRRHGSAHGRLIPWTQEREDFFAGMKAALEGLIERLATFDTQLTENVTAAIDNFATGRHLLAAPEVK